MRKKTKSRKYDGLPVVDADKSIILQIGKQDISGSRKSDPANCAAARACKREFKKETRVFLTRMYVKEKTHWTRYITPESISREITAFDRGAAFAPGTYRAMRPSVSAKLGHTRGDRGTKPEEKTNRQPYD